MTSVFADTSFWVALINPTDQLHAKATEARRRLSGSSFVTSELVLVEVLNYFAALRSRLLAAATVRDIVEDQNVEVVPHTRDGFLAGLAFYEARPDKGYSVTDCVSMLAMRERGISEVLTHDHHFEQEGFAILL
jgi:predicted nucleic acid-binding protein